MAGEIPDHIRDAASVWVERLNRGLSDAEERELATWLGSDPVRHAAMRRAELLWDKSAGTSREALGLGPAVARAPFYLRSGPRIAIGTGLVALAVGSLSIAFVPRLAGWSVVQPAAAELLSTRIGVIRQFDLDAGTNVTLDTASELKASGSRGERKLELKRGRVRITMGGGSIAPLTMRVGSWTVAADDAVFDADLIAATPRIKVKEGAVRVRLPLAAAATLRAGEAISGDVPIAVPTPSQVDNWPSGILTLNSTPVSEAVAAINRYNDRKIVLGDRSIGSMRLSGGYRVRDPLGFARGVATAYHLRVDLSDPLKIRLIQP